MTAVQKSRLDIHQAVTDKIIKAIEAGVIEWQMPWHRPGTSFSIPENALTGNTYRGINILSLWIDADVKKFEHQVWATYKQFQELGCQVRGGEKASLIVKYGDWTPKSDPTNSSETDEEVKRMYARPAWVFNIAQVDGFELPNAIPRPDLTTRIAHVDNFIANTKIEIREGGQRAFYRQPTSDGQGDYVQLPLREYFTGTATSTPTESYEATRLHECLHASGAKHRLDRQFGKRFGDDDYAFEELLVEIATATMCCTLGITNEPRPDHAQYCDHWLRILKGDNRAIFSASAAASRAIDFLNSLQPSKEPVATTEA